MRKAKLRSVELPMKENLSSRVPFCLYYIYIYIYMFIILNQKTNYLKVHKPA